MIIKTFYDMKFIEPQEFSRYHGLRTKCLENMSVPAFIDLETAQQVNANIF